MLTFYDYLPSQNGWKVRQILAELAIPHRTELIGIFAGEGRSARYLSINPWGAVPAIELADGRTLSESNAILWYLAQGSDLLPDDAFLEAKVLQWMSFEADYVQPTIGSLRYWTLTGKIGSRDPALVANKRAAGERALGILDRQLARTDYIVGTRTIADISLFAYAGLAADVRIELAEYPAFSAWCGRMAYEPTILAPRFPYSDDPMSAGELP